jgi:HD-like signal output (HDOD) protein
LYRNIRNVHQDQDQKEHDEQCRVLKAIADLHDASCFCAEKQGVSPRNCSIKLAIIKSESLRPT